MGVLNQVGAALGQYGGASSATAGSAAYNSLGVGTLSTGTDALARLFTGIGGYEQRNFAASVQEQNARTALLGGQLEEQASKLRYGALEAKQEATQAGSGVGVNSATAVNVRRSTQEISDIDAALIHYNAAREAYGAKTQATLDSRAAGGALTQGLLGAGNSLISGATGLSDKWLQYKLSGAIPGGSGMTVPTDNG